MKWLKICLFLFDNFYIKEESEEQNQQIVEMESYIKSFKHSHFKSVINKRNEDGKNNAFYYGTLIAGLLDQRNKELLINETLKERYDLLSRYNRNIHCLTGHTMQLFKTVNHYSETQETGNFTKLKIIESDVFNSLKSIKEITKSIKHNCLNNEFALAKKIMDNSVLMFEDCIDLLNDSFGIDIYKSPLKNSF